MSISSHLVSSQLASSLLDLFLQATKDPFAPPSNILHEVRECVAFMPSVRSSLLLFCMIISADEDHDGAQDKMQTKIKVDHNGTNTWLAPSILKSSCKINVRYFPFDEQVRFRITANDLYFLRQLIL